MAHQPTPSYSVRRRWRYHLCLAIILIFNLTGCAAKIRDLWRDPEFTPNRLKASSLTIGGIGCSLAGTDQEGLSQLLDSVVFLSLRNEISEVRISDLGLMRHKLGDSLQRKLLSSFLKLNTIIESDAAIIRNGYTDSPTYLLFGNMVQNKIVRKSVTMNSGQSDQHEVENNERHMRFLFAIYDTRDGRQVWRCDLSAVRPTESGEEDPTADYFDITNPVGSLLTQLVHGTSPDTSPIRSSTGRVMRVIFERLAECLVAEN